MAKANRKFRENDLFGRHYKLSLAPTKQIQKVEKERRKRKRLERRVMNKLKHGGE